VKTTHAPADAREGRRRAVAADRIDLAPEGRLGQHDPEQRGKQGEDQDRHGNAERVALAENV
jgi:hypothetical protein